MSELIDQMSGLKLKVEKLVNLHKLMSDQNTVLKRNEAELIKKIEDKDQEITELREKTRLIKLAHAVSESDQNTRDLKIKINEYIREIDKCIALINR